MVDRVGIPRVVNSFFSYMIELLCMFVGVIFFINFWKLGKINSSFFLDVFLSG